MACRLLPAWRFLGFRVLAAVRDATRDARSERRPGTFVHTLPGTQLDECTVTTVACTRMHLELPGKCILVLWQNFTPGLGRMCNNYCIQQPDECTVTTVACTPECICSCPENAFCSSGKTSQKSWEECAGTTVASSQNVQ